MGPPEDGTRARAGAGAVLIAGCGYVGTALGLRLVAGGDRVWGLRRDPGRLPRGIAPLEADLAVAADLVDLPGRAGAGDGFDAVVYAASASGRDDEAYRRVYVEGLGHLLEAARRWPRPPGRFLFTSSTGVYGQDDGSWVDEGSPTEPGRFSGRRMVEAEALLAASPLRTVAVRLGGIYGPGRTRTIDRVREGRLEIGDGEPAYLNHIHRDDCAGVLAHLLALPDPAPVYVAVDDEPVERREAYRWLAVHLGVAGPALAAASAAPPARWKRCRNRRLRASGYAFLHPTFREGYASLVAAAQAPGLS